MKQTNYCTTLIVDNHIYRTACDTHYLGQCIDCIKSNHCTVDCWLHDTLEQGNKRSNGAHDVDIPTDDGNIDRVR